MPEVKKGAIHEPIRTCVGCRERSARSALVRLAERDGALRLDAAGRLPGRGAYLHAKSACLRAFARRGGFVRSLRCVIPKGEREAFCARFPEVHG